MFRGDGGTIVERIGGGGLATTPGFPSNRVRRSRGDRLTGAPTLGISRELETAADIFMQMRLAAFFPARGGRGPREQCRSNSFSLESRVEIARINGRGLGKRGGERKRLPARDKGVGRGLEEMRRQRETDTGKQVKETEGSRNGEDLGFLLARSSQDFRVISPGNKIIPALCSRLPIVFPFAATRISYSAFHPGISNFLVIFPCLRADVPPPRPPFSSSSVR